MADRTEKGRFVKGHANFTKKGKRPNQHGNSGSFKKGQKAHNDANTFTTCAQCNTRFKISPASLKEKNFCNKHCLDSFRRNKPITEEGCRAFYTKQARRVLTEAGIDFSCMDIHHIDGNFKNNNLSNLELMSESEHGRYHASRRDMSDLGVKGAFARWGV